ncbi:hypothetical protein BN946_scf184970.g97 [Trametes cinnabarina]|uniref:DNA 3'-5' helicase n=1 Tax=Pycnoporus cinnabarinus TaxID=5643 RepID=A0A060SD14_PYCCI|nr:hypothetical protein BN946_scf184970.g97 [Trametes cinnabarina]
MPMLFRPEGIQIVITPLNILGAQTKAQLDALGISAIAIRGETATYANIEAIIALQFRVIAVSPEIALNPRGVFERVWRSMAFVSRIISIVWDEAHLLKAWSSFRPDLGDASRLRNVLSPNIPYLLPSATLPEAVLGDVLDIARVNRQHVLVLRRSNDRPNVFLTVRKIRFAFSSFKDLKFLVETVLRGLKFLVFFDNIEESIKACLVVRQWLPPEHHDRIVWFNADNTTRFRESTTAKFQCGELIGLFCTDAFGMGIDIPDIDIVVQWRPTCSLDSLWQRFGRAARDPNREAIAVLFADAKYFDEEREAARKRAEKRRQAALARAERVESGKRKRIENAQTGSEELREAKRSRADEQVPTGLGAARVQHSDVSQVADLSEGLSEYDKLRVSYKTGQSHEETASQAAKKGKKGGGASRSSTVVVELDCLINAATRAFRCYQDEQLRCKMTTGEDCTRCTLQPSPICCSLCTPNHHLFALLPPTDEPVEKPKALRSSQVDTQYSMNAKDSQFRAALHALRKEHTVRLYGISHLHELGAGAVMSDDVLKRILDCARAHKIHDLDSLHRETKWHWAEEIGNAVLELISK